MAVENKQIGTKEDKKNLKKEAFLKYYQETYGDITQSAKLTGISRGTYYKWINNDPKFLEEINAIEPKEMLVDFFQSQLVKRAVKEDTTAIIFGLKSLGKHRGWVEKTETEIDNKALEIKITRAD